MDRKYIFTSLRVDIIL